MREIILLVLALWVVTAAALQSETGANGKNDDLKPEATRQRIYEIINSHENKKYGDHGGHEYEEGEIPRNYKRQKSRRVGYLPVHENENVQAHYVTDPRHQQVPIGKVYRENVNPYAAEKASTLYEAKVPHRIVASPVSNSHYAVVDPKTHDEYVVVNEPKPVHKPRPLILDPKLQASYHLVRPGSYYVPPNHHSIDGKPKIPQVVQHPAPIKSDISPIIHHPVAVNPKIPQVVHYPDYHVPVKDHGHYENHHQTEDKGHHASGHEYYGDNGVQEESAQKAHGHHEVAGHKAHSSAAGHHDNHDHYHNRGLYERDRGYHYEKAYAYDRVRAHHDVDHDKAAHSAYNTHHNEENHKDAGQHGGESYVYFKKNDHHGSHGYDNNSLHKRGHHNGGQGYYDYGPKYYLPHHHHHHSYGKLL